MHYHHNVAPTFPDFDAMTAIAPVPLAVGSCGCREVSDCSSSHNNCRDVSRRNRNRRKLLESPPRYDDDSTVVCGRGKGAYNRPGNKRFRRLIRSHLAAYVAAPNKYQKGLIIQQMAYDVDAQGLVFVRKANDGDGGREDQDEWCELDAKERRDKIGHAIREAVAEQKHHATIMPARMANKQQQQQQQEATQPYRYEHHDSSNVAHHLLASDSTINTAHSLDDSIEDLDLEDRRSRFDRMLESFRMGQSTNNSHSSSNENGNSSKLEVVPEADNLLHTDISFFEV